MKSRSLTLLYHLDPGPCPFKDHPILPTVASGPSSSLASSGAFIAEHVVNFTSTLIKQLPPSVQLGIDSASQYIETKTGFTPTLFYTSVAGAALLLSAIPTAYARTVSRTTTDNEGRGKKNMSRRGWSSHERGGLSPFGSSVGDGRCGVPEVTEADYSYITSEDLEATHDVDGARHGRGSSSGNYTRSAGGPALVIDDDDILLIKHKGVTYPEHFPAYSIGDGKLQVGDVRERVQMILKLSDRRTRKVKLLYKGKQLKNDNEAVCAFNVKNNSEVLVVLPEAGPEDSSSESSEEVVVVGKDDEGRTKKKKSKKRSKKNRNTSTSPRDSTSNLEVPGAGGSRPQSPASAVSGTSAAASGPMEKLNTISSHFTTKLLPLCVQFTASPPTDPKKREDEHRKLSETIMQQVLLKLDEVETNGEEEARARRKELVRTVQNVLKGLDNKLAE